MSEPPKTDPSSTEEAPRPAAEGAPSDESGTQTAEAGPDGPGPALSRRFAVASEALRQPFQTLTGRIIAVALSTVIVTSLAVTWISTHSTGTFLREKIDDKFPAILTRTRDRIDLWYGQRVLDLSTFAGSETLREQVPALPSRRSGARARREIDQYLQYVLDRFPQYEALFVRSSAGEELIWVGSEIEVPKGLLAKVPAPSTRTWIGELLRVGDRRIQLVSARIGDGERSATLHAIMRHEHLDRLLGDDDLSEEGHILLVDPAGDVLAPLGAALPALPKEAPIARGDELPRVREYHVFGGDRVIASATTVDRLGWTLWVVEPYSAAFAPVVSMTRRVATTNLFIVVLFGAIAFWVARSVVRPIHDLSDAARRIADGEDDVDLPMATSQDEVGVLTDVLRAMTDRLGAKTAEVQRANEVLLQLAVTDELTALANHRAFRDALNREVSRSRRNRSDLTLVLADVDDFKKLNDQHGHAAGDDVLREVAARMAGAVRQTDFLARYGGEEFALLLPDTDLDHAREVAEKVRMAISAQPVEVDEGTVTVTASFGVARFEGDSRKLFSEADASLYGAKQAGKDCVVCAEDEPPKSRR